MELTLEAAATCLLIIVARIADVSLGTVRTIMVINGRRGISWVLGFFEVLIWILVVTSVIKTIGESRNLLFPIAYALGFASGNFIGITIENRLAFGDQAVRVFTRAGLPMASAMRDSGHRVTEFDGRGRDGPVTMLYIETRRRDVRKVTAEARRIDPECFYVVDDVRAVSAASPQTGGWRSALIRR